KANIHTHNHHTKHNDGSGSLPSPITPTMITSNALPILDLLLIHLQRDTTSTTPATTPIAEKAEGEVGGIQLSQTPEQERVQLESELEQLKQLSFEAEQTYKIIHATIQEYQQLVLSTHAQVAAAKKSLLLVQGSGGGGAGGGGGTNNHNHNNHNTVCSNESSRASSPPASPVLKSISTSNSLSMSISMTLSAPCSRSDSYPLMSPPLPNSMIEGDEDDMDEETRLKRQHADLGRKLTSLLREKAAAEETKKRMNDGLLKAKARIKELEQSLGNVA
ncbi:hypothetical protein BGZ76_003764, partial [Entomortierella beljakovae]